MDSTCVFLLVLFSFTFGQEPLIPCDDILEENTRLKAENGWLKDVIRDNLTQLAEMIQSNAGNIQNNAGNIQDNADNLGIVDLKVNSNNGHIVSTNRRVDENKAYIDQNTANIEENRDIIDNVHLAPIGTISAWVTKPTKETREDEMVSLPDGWVRCDGATIPEPSVWAGQLTPNLNGEKRFLRGSSDSEMLTMEEDQMQDHKHQVSDPGHSHSYDDKYTSYNEHDDGAPGPKGADNDDERFDKSHDRTSGSSHSGLTVEGVSSGNSGSETRPKNMNVIYIMRVW